MFNSNRLHMGDSKTTDLEKIAIVNQELNVMGDIIRKKYFPELLPIGFLLDGKSRRINASFWRGKKGHEPIITVSKHFFQKESPERVSRTILHELIHYKLFHEGKPAGHTDTFKTLAWDLGLKNGGERNWRWKYLCRGCRKWWKLYNQSSNFQCKYCRRDLTAEPTSWWKAYCINKGIPFDKD